MRKKTKCTVLLENKNNLRLFHLYDVTNLCSKIPSFTRVNYIFLQDNTKVVSLNPAHGEVYSTTLCDQVCQCFATCQWFAPGILFISIDNNKTIKDWSHLCSVHEEITSVRLYTLCNPRSTLRKGVYNLIEVISNEPNK